MPVTSAVLLAETEWKSRAQDHRARLEPFVSEHLARRKRGEKHPIWDFLFDYYSHKPTHLLRWSPGAGIELENGDELLAQKEFSRTENGVALDLSKFPPHRIESLREILELLEASTQRAPFHGCFGLHEWAMVYRAPEVRHAVPLRLSHPEIADFVESQTVRCSHYDAFRFFTPDAIALNTLSPRYDDRPDFEQPGCIHANMDLYKWAYKFAPWISSELVADAFFLAREARELDMKAAPYDLRAAGFEPIPIETVEGRAEYVKRQREIAEKALPIRQRLVEEYQRLLTLVTGAFLLKTVSD